MRTSGHKPRLIKLGVARVRATTVSHRSLSYVTLLISTVNPAAGNGAIPFNTQFFHDDYDDGPGFDDAFDGGSAAPADMTDPGEQDLLAATAGQTRRVRPEFVNYAKRAKRVDVRKLKENIWKGLEIVVPEPREPDEMVGTPVRARVSWWLIIWFIDHSGD